MIIWIGDLPTPPPPVPPARLEVSAPASFARQPAPGTRRATCPQCGAAVTQTEARRWECWARCGYELTFGEEGGR